MNDPRQIPILAELDAGAIARQIKRSEFFWCDLSLDSDVTPERIGDAFSLAPATAEALGHFGRETTGGSRLRRKVHGDAEHVLFPFWYLGSADADVSQPPEALNVREVKVLLTGDYLLTVHEVGDELRKLVGGQVPSGRSERYAVYLVLEAMTSTLFEALAVLQDAMGDLEAAVLASEGRTQKSDPQLVRGTRLRLTELRRIAGPEQVLFERASGEMEQVPGLQADDRPYFERISKQLDRAIQGIDAVGGELSSALEVQLNATTYRLTIVATIFLPLTFLTGFFGMNFGWMVDQVDTAAGFWLLGVGGCLCAVALIIGFLLRTGALGAKR